MNNFAFRDFDDGPALIDEVHGPPGLVPLKYPLQLKRFEDLATDGRPTAAKRRDRTAREIVHPHNGTPISSLP